VRVLAFRHVPFEGLGLIEPVLESRGIAFDYADLYQADLHQSNLYQADLDQAVPPIPDISRYDGLIFLGGPMSANDPLPYLRTEMGVIEHALTAGTPVLGVCLGAQLMASALGARVYRNAEREIGWFDIHLAPGAASDPVFAGLRQSETVFHWHSDTFDLPAGAELLARSDRTERQAFRYGRVWYGIQFHLEVNPPMIVDWCLQDQNCGDMCELSAPPDPQFNRTRLNEIAKLVFGRWCDLLR